MATSTGTPLLFLHDGAWGASSDVSWHHVLHLAAMGHPVIAPDLLGYGDTEKSIVFDGSAYGFRLAHLSRLLNELSVDGPVHIVGTSFGGSLALRALADERWHGKVASVVSINGTGGPWRAAKMATALGPFDGSRKRVGEIVEALTGPLEAGERDLQVSSRYRWAIDPGHYQVLSSIQLSVPDSMKVTSTDGYPESLAGTVVPLLLVIGERDDLLEAGWAEKLQRIRTNAQIRRLPAYHSPNISHPNETWAVVSEFLDGLTCKPT